MSHSLTGHSTARIFSRAGAYISKSLHWGLVALVVGGLTASLSFAAPVKKPPAKPAVGAAAPAVAPVEYVKVCSLYGAGFYYLPGTNTCIKTYVGVEAGYGWGNSNFSVSPPFSVDNNGGAFGMSAGLQVGIPGTRLSVGPDVFILWPRITGSIANPAASPTFAYDVKTIDAVVGADLINFVYDFPLSDEWTLSLGAGVGVASVGEHVHAVSGGFSVDDSHRSTGFTANVHIGAPIPDTPAEWVLRYRYIQVPSANFNIPGMVPISGNINVVTFGAQWNFGGSSDRIIRTTNIRSQNQ